VKKLCRRDNCVISEKKKKPETNEEWGWGEPPVARQKDLNAYS